MENTTANANATPDSLNSLENSDRHDVIPPLGHSQDDNLYSASSTRKRKISKMWESVYGTTITDNNLFGHALYTALGRANEHDNRQPQKELRKDSTTKMANWRVDEIDGSLAADFDDSLSGLGVELGTASYDMSQALLALPTLPVFKQEPDSENGIGGPSSPNVPCTTSSRCQHVQPPSPQVSTVNTGALSPHGSLLLHSTTAYNPSNSSVISQCSYQYLLGAATSIATKTNEETLTYLNQGQSYEIKLKKLGDLTECRGKLLKSIVRVCFHERRLQYMEKEQILNWKQMRPGERILEIDIPLSYGICDIVQDHTHLNACEFVWDPTKETGVFIRVNCISTEFTPKKHGGEKGVPFRIQIETYTNGEGTPQHLHSASCQVKVFKPKGADRKHKTDREKMEKRTAAEQEKFRPSYNCTILTECSPDSIYSAPTPPASVSSSIPLKNESIVYSPVSVSEQRAPGTPTSLNADSPVLDASDTLDSCSAFDFMHLYQQPLPSDASSSQTTQWLQANRFGNYVRTFSSFSGADILRLSRDDLIQICGLANGIRLYNALHSRAIRPRLTIYVCLESEQVYHAIYLENLTVDEMITKLAQLINFQLQNVHNVYILGPSGIHVLITDEVVRNFHEESMFLIELIKDASGDGYHLLLKSSAQH